MYVKHTPSKQWLNDIRIYDQYYLAVYLLSVLTGKEYNRMARKRSTMMRMMSPMKRHLNLLHKMNFMVLHGLVNQKKDVSGRLVVMENERQTVCFLCIIVY